MENQEIEGMKRQVNQLQQNQETIMEILTELMSRLRPFLISQIQLDERIGKWIQQTDKKLSSMISPQTN